MTREEKVNRIDRLVHGDHVQIATWHNWLVAGVYLGFTLSGAYVVEDEDGGLAAVPSEAVAYIRLTKPRADSHL